jgi:hypothetical protein
LEEESQLPPPQPLTCVCFELHPDPRRPQHTRIQSPYCPMLPYPEFREEPCICFATALRPWEIPAHSDVTSPDCPFNVHRQSTASENENRGRSSGRASSAAAAASRSRAGPCSSCGEFGHRNNQNSLCLHRIFGRVFQPFVQGSPGRMYHGEEAPSLSERCEHCKCSVGMNDAFVLVQHRLQLTTLKHSI